MRRLRLFTIAAGMSLMIFTATVALWLRGHWQADQIVWASENYVVEFSTANSVMAVMFGPQYKSDPPIHFKPNWQYQHYPARYRDLEMLRCQIPLAEYHRLGWLGFAYDPDHVVNDYGRLRYSSNRLYFPNWSLAAITSILPAAWCWRWRRERVRRKLGHCVNCGYDLRATPQLCPECGAAPQHNPPLRAFPAIP